MMAAVALEKAHLVIVATGRYELTRRIAGNLAQFYRGVPVMAAVDYLMQREELHGLGVENVVALATQASLAFGQSILVSLGVPAARAEEIVGALKADDYGALRRSRAVDVQQV
jgi:voltage-gated potassium channel Kch